MTSFRIRVLTFILIIFAAVPALAQESAQAAVNPAASLGCLLAGLGALAAVGLLSNMRDRQGEQDPTVQPNPDEMANTPTA